MKITASVRPSACAGSWLMEQGSRRKPSANKRMLSTGKLRSSPRLPDLKPIQQSSDELTRSLRVYLHQRISDWDRLRATSPNWIGRCQLGRPLQHLASKPHLACFPGLSFTPYILTLMAVAELVNDKLPRTPSRLMPPQFITRIVTSALCGLAIGLPE